jgi:hypothetical protein
MNPSITRRQLAAALAGALPAAAQTPAVVPATELAKAVEQMRSNSKALSTQSVPMSTEPAFVFKP